MTKRKFNEIIDDNTKVIVRDKKNKLEAKSSKELSNQVTDVSGIIYSNQSIKLMLKNYLLNVNIEDVYLYKLTGDHIYYHFVNDLKTQLKNETKDRMMLDDKFYVVIEISDAQSLVSSATILKLYNKNNKNQIKILPIVGSTSGSLRDELKKALELSKISIKVDDLSDWFLGHQSTTGIYLDNLIEVIKLSIEYKSPSKIPDDKIEEVMNTPYTAYEKMHQELLNRLKLTTVDEIEQLDIVEQNQDKFGASANIKKIVSWHPEVKDNEGSTIRRKKYKFKVKTKEQDEIEEYFEQCITSWNWDKQIWEKYFNTNRLDSDKFQHLLDKHCDRIMGAFGSNIFKKYRYDHPDCYRGYNQVKEELLNKIIEGYIFLISYSPRLLNLLVEEHDSMLETFSQCNIDMLGFYKAHPELKLINLIKKRIGNIDIDEKDQGSIIISISDDKTDTEILVDITNYNQENSELKLTGNIVDSDE